MDSMETNLLQQQEVPKKNTQKPCILSLIFVLTLIVAGILTVTTVIVIRQSSPSSSMYTYVDLTPSKSIQAICSFAPYKHLCLYALLSIISTNTSSNEFKTHISPENMVFHSFQLSVTQLTHLSNITKRNDITESVLLECQVLLNKDLSGLNDSVTSAKNLYYFTRLEVDEYVEVFTRMETYQQACLDKLEESTAGSKVIDEIRSNVEKTRQYMSNTRTILVKLDPILDSIYGSPSSSTVDHYSYYFDGLSYEYMIIFVPQYVFLILLFILMLKSY